MRRNNLTYDHRTRGNERELIRKCKFQNDNTVASGAPTTEAIPAKARAMPKPGPLEAQNILPIRRRLLLQSRATVKKPAEEAEPKAKTGNDNFDQQ